jgi:hypothetical protein
MNTQQLKLAEIDISQKKLYEKLIILEKYCIKLEKRVTNTELENKKLREHLNLVKSNTNTNNDTNITTNTTAKPKTKKIPAKSTTDKSATGGKKVKKIFDKYNMKPLNI